MSARLMVLTTVCLALLLLPVSGAYAHDAAEVGERASLDYAPGVLRASGSDVREHARLETLWIFEADFEDLSGDNAGWFSLDRSGTLGQENYWHKDTIRLTESYLGDSTWWCGTENPCWFQPRGYGNDWVQYLHQDLPLASWSTAGDDVYLEFDQRFAMEHDYDYGFVEVSDDGGGTWTTLYTANNPGFAGKPGTPKDWDSDEGHKQLSLGPWAGEDIRLRFRFESDALYSAEDEYNNPGVNSVQDGAWQIDNIEITVNSSQVWLDDAEAPGENGWGHEGIPHMGATGLQFYRGLYGTDFETGRPFTCENRSGWMWAAVDPFTGTVVDDENTWIVSPPIDISGAEKLSARWDYWLDCPFASNDRYDLWLASSDEIACVQDPSGFVDEDPGGWYGGPWWGTKNDSWDAFAGNDWLAVNLRLYNLDAADPGTHKAGYILNWVKVGIPTGDSGTAFTYGQWDRFNDWFVEQMADALEDTALITVVDDDDIASVTLMASNDDGDTWEAYPCVNRQPLSDEWYADPPVNQMTPGSEIHYYYEAVDGAGNVATWPAAAPDSYYEFSILPIDATVSDPGILLVDKHKRYTPGETRYLGQLHTSEYYYREALGILGYEWETYDVEVESGTRNSEGPDSMGYKYYDTIIWFSNYFPSYTYWPVDQQNLINWLNQSAAGKERNFMATGCNWAYELMDTGAETLDFVTQWLAVEYVQDGVGEVTVDSMPTVQDVAGNHTFMDHADGACLVRGACPIIHHFDVLAPFPGTSGTEVTTEYLKLDSSTLPAGVAYTHPTYGYQTVSLGYGLEFMVNEMLPNGYYRAGVEDRVNFMENVMAYFSKTPTENPTGVVDDTRRNALSHAYPNPFNPVTKIAYSVRDAGPVTIDIYNVAGKVVRTLLDTELDAGATGYVVWDGSTDSGTTCASGVYFYRMTAPGFSESRRVVMLK